MQQDFKVLLLEPEERMKNVVVLEMQQTYDVFFTGNRKCKQMQRLVKLHLTSFSNYKVAGIPCSEIGWLALQTERVCANGKYKTVISFLREFWVFINIPVTKNFFLSFQENFIWIKYNTKDYISL